MRVSRNVSVKRMPSRLDHLWYGSSRKAKWYRVMIISTSRFGNIAIRPEDILTFEQGIIGLEECRQWILMSDSENDALGWLQSTENPEVAFAVVSPRRFVSDYKVRVSSRDLVSLKLLEAKQAQVLVILNHEEGDQLTLNLKAPLIIHLGSSQGCQVIAKNNLPIAYPLSVTIPLRKSA